MPPVKPRGALSLLAGLLAIGLIAAGCGDDDEGGETGALTKQEFIAQADAICQRDSEEIAQAGSEIESQADVDEFVSKTLIPKLQDEIDSLGDLGVPEGDDAQVEAILDAAQQGLDEIKADPSLAQSQATNPLNEASALAQDYGLKVCGQS